MSDNFWKRLSLVFGLLTLTSIFALLVFVANLEIKDLDLWLHIGMGRYIVEHGFQVPSVDVLSHTIAGKPWVNHEWLFQVIVYYIFTHWGADGLITMQVILVSLTMMILLFLGYNKDKQLGSIFILLLVSLVYQQRFTIRPDLYSLLFFALYILILSFYLERKWSVYAILVIQILWSNIHGFFFFGPLFALIGVVAEWIKRHVKLPYEWNKAGRLNDDEYGRLKIILLISALACCLNPLAFRGAWYPISVFFQLSGESKVFFERIIELKRPITGADIFSMNENPFYKLLIILSFISFVFNRRKLDIGVLIFWLIFLFFSLSAIRNVIYFAFAAYLVFVTNSLNISLKDIVPIRITDRKFIHLLSIFCKIALLFWVLEFGINISSNGYFDFDKFERKSEFGGISQRNFPTKMVDFLVENKVQGNFFNDFNSGAYLVGRTYPDIKVFIDGRTEVYGPAFFKYYQSLWEGDNEQIFAEALDRFKITGILFNSVHQPIPKNVLNYVYRNKEWVPVYFDYDGVVFLKEVPINEEVIAHHRLDLAKPREKEFDLLRLGAKNVTPYQHINRAFTLESLGLQDAAVFEAQEALKILPSYKDPYKILGKVYAQRKDYKKAFENFRIAVVLGPDDLQNRLNLGMAYSDLGEYKYAIEQYAKIICRWPGDPKAYFFLTKTYIKNIQYDKAIETLKAAHQVDPKDVNDLLLIGDFFYMVKDYNRAKAVYEMALETQKELPRIHTKLGVVYKASNELSKAQEHFKKALEFKPEDNEIQNQLSELGNALAPH